MGVRETVDGVVGIVIAGRAVPIISARVGRKLDHPERQGRPRKCVPVTAGADEWIYPVGEVAGLGCERRQKAEGGKQRKKKLSHKSQEMRPKSTDWTAGILPATPSLRRRQTVMVRQ